MLIHSDKSLLLVVDIQEKLLPAVDGPERLVTNCRWLLEIAQYLKVPVLGTEQYPSGIGPTVEPIRTLLPPDRILEKLHFSCASDPGFNASLDTLDPQQVILIGMEAHVCVLQTALELQRHGREVYVVADCISSRNPDDKALALERLRGDGVRIVTREMVAFEWMRRCGTDSFRHISRHYLR